MDKIKCCANCGHCIAFPKNNRYGDIEYFCTVNGYFTVQAHKDISNVKHFTPGGRELECRYEEKKEKYLSGKEIEHEEQNRI